jgi:NTE family protein
LIVPTRRLKPSAKPSALLCIPTMTAKAPALWVGVFLLALAAEGRTATGVCVDPATVTGPKIGLVLGGGGARGAAHIGVIRRLEELRVPVHFIGGTSMGALVGGFYATGMSAGQLQETVEAIDFEELFKDATERQEQAYRRKRDDDLSLFGPKFGVGRDSVLLPRGAVHGQKISYLFEQLTSERTRERDFNRLPIPYRAVAADIETGVPVVLAEGSLSLAMRSSMSVPGVFDPVEWGDHILVDGGIANNLPIDVVRDLGAEVIIAVEVGTPPASRDRLRNLTQYVGQLSNLMIANNTKAQIATLTSQDTLIRPELGDQISSSGFSKAPLAIEIGYQAAVAASSELLQYAVSAEDYARYQRAVESCVPGPTEIQFVEIEDRSRFSEAVIAARLQIDPAQPLASADLQKSISRVYGLGFIDLVRHEIIDRDGRTGARVTVDQDARGTNFLEWGLDVSSDGDDASVDLRLALLKVDVDDYGSEMRILAQIGDTPAIGAEIYKALEPNLRWFLRPRVAAEWRDFTVFEDQGNPSRAIKARQYLAELTAIRELGNQSAVWAGVRYFEGETNDEFQRAPQGQDIGDYRGGEYLIGYDFDGVDDRYFPKRGAIARIVYSASEPGLGADSSFEQLNLSLFRARTWGPHTILGRLRYKTTLDGDAPYYADFRAGGPFELSGLDYNQLAADNYGIALGSWRYQLPVGPGLFPATAGISLEYGNVSDDRDELFSDAISAGSLYFGYRSPIGPLYWGIGFAEGGERAYFLKIGDIFGGSSIGR